MGRVVGWVAGRVTIIVLMMMMMAGVKWIRKMRCVHLTVPVASSTAAPTTTTIIVDQLMTIACPS